jgi:hypothetical protein
LDALLWIKEDKKAKPKKPVTRVEPDDEDVDMEPRDDLPEELKGVFEEGEPPNETWAVGPSDWEQRKWDLTEDDIDKVCWVFTKWGDLGYEEGESSRSALL